MTIDRLTGALADRYTIERELGAGGMATVYLAQDLRHDRRVAIKVLRPELAAVIGAERFLSEIKTTANLQHPHILPLHDSGEADGFLFYVMPYVEGESLRDRLDREKQLPVDEAVRLATEVAGALDYAHRHGVIHRDIKPENILLHDGSALVADFGIALAAGTADASRLTSTGISLGTPLYMSPEQASGETGIDGRTDQYSLGCVLYEMLTGEPPYTGASRQAILAKRLREPAPDIRTLRETVPDALAAAVRRALARAPVDRFPSVKAFATALMSGAARAADLRDRRGWSRGARVALSAAIVIAAGAGAVAFWPRDTPTVERVAVLAPVPLGDPAQAPLTVGVYSGLVTALGEAGAAVIGGVRTMQQYQASQSSIADIVAALGVDVIVEPSVTWEDDSVSIGVRLLEGRTETARWAHQVRGAEREVPALVQEMAGMIAAEIRTGGSRTVSNAPAHLADAEVQRAYLQGTFYMGRLTPADLARAIDYFGVALAADSSFAPAWAGLAWTWIARQQMGFVSPEEATPIAVRSAHRAVALDSLLPAAHYAVAVADGWAGWNWDIAERELRRALALNPAYGDARADLSHVLLVQHRIEEAVAQADSALAADPLNLKYQVFQAVVYAGAGRVAPATEQLEGVLRVIPNNPAALWMLASLSFREGRRDTTIGYVASALRGDGYAAVAEWLRDLYARRGFGAAMRAAAESLAMVSRNRWVPPVEVAVLYAYARDTTRTLGWLEQGLAGREPNLPYVGINPMYRYLHGHPRFEALLLALHLPPSEAG